MELSELLEALELMLLAQKWKLGREQRRERTVELYPRQDLQLAQEQVQADLRVRGPELVE